MQGLMRPLCGTIVILLGFAAIAVNSPAGEFVFETDFVRYVITAEGRTSSLFDKTNNTELLASKVAPFASVRLKDGKTADASSIKRDGDVFHVEFKPTGVTATYKISSTADYILIRLVSLEGPQPEQLQLAQLQLVPFSNSGSWIVAQWNEKIAVSMMGLSEQVHTQITGASITASLYSDFGLAGNGAAIVAAPTPRFLNVVRKFETGQHLPYCRVNGQWGKTSADVKTSYLFTDMTESNVDDVIRYANLGGFRYILIYASTWAQSWGSYLINTGNFPDGEKGLGSVIDKCHRAGLKVGLHMLTSLISKNDPLVSSNPSMLFTNFEAILSRDISERESVIAASSSADSFSKIGSTADVRIGEELLQCSVTKRMQTDAVLSCTRGAMRTKAVSHKSGEKIQVLPSFGGAYFADLNTVLMNKVSARIADLFNRYKLDMIYFDAGELNSIEGPFWYWVSRQQMDIWKRINHDFLVQGSGSTSWTWHIWCRNACDDQVVTAVKQYLNIHKIAGYEKYITDNFMPADLGWWGIWDDAPDRRATTPDEAELLGIRSIAYDAAFSLETHVERLKANGRTEEILHTLSQCERLRLSGKAGTELRNKLRSGEWHLVEEGGKTNLYPVVYSSQYGLTAAAINQTNPFKPQPFRFRLAAVPILSEPGNKANIVLCNSKTGFAIKTPDAKNPGYGIVAGRIEFIKGPGPQAESVFRPTGAEATSEGERTSINLTKHRALAVTLKVDGAAPASGNPPAVLNIQLNAAEQFREHYIDMDFAGERTIIIREPTSERLLQEFNPAVYSPKLALLGFNYSGVDAVNIRWMRPLPAGTEAKVSLIRVEALAENNATLQNPRLLINDESLEIPAELKIDDYAEFWGSGPIRIFDANGHERIRLPQPQHIPMLRTGANTIILKTAGSSDFRLTAITLGDPLSP
jgi:hypothetical protein